MSTPLPGTQLPFVALDGTDWPGAWDAANGGPLCLAGAGKGVHGFEVTVTVTARTESERRDLGG